MTEINRQFKFTDRFTKELKSNGLYDIVVADSSRDIPAPKTLRNFGGYTNDQIKNGIYSLPRDTYLPKIQNAIQIVLTPWIMAGSGDELPHVSIQELSRISRIPTPTLIKVIQDNPITQSIGGVSYEVNLRLPDLTKASLTIENATALGVSPKRLIRLSRYESRPPGGGPVQRARFQEKKVDGVLKPLAQNKAVVRFIKKEDEIPIIPKAKDLRKPQYAKPIIEASAVPTKTFNLGILVERSDIKSSEGPFLYAPEYDVQYPESVTNALSLLYAEYNRAFTQLVRGNIEWPEDYRYCTGPGGLFVNRWVQIDMPGLATEFLKGAMEMTPPNVVNILRSKIFEIENSLAMYQLSMRSFPRGNQPSFFDLRFRESLETIRRQYKKPVALLATTDEKYRAMRKAEFGKYGEDQLTDREVQDLSGFDRFFSPSQFREQVEFYGDSKYLLFVRDSDPIQKLRRPDIKIQEPLLSDARMRRIIKRNSLTLNVDNPAWSMNDVRRIKDTKLYLPPMGMGIPISNVEDLDSEAMTTFVRKVRGQDIPAQQDSVELRAKPMRSAYGAYGQLSGTVSDGEFRRRLRGEMRLRGDYIVQPEMLIPLLVNGDTGLTYGYTDRLFMSYAENDYQFMEGFRYLVPVTSEEYKRGRMHANAETITARIGG